MRLLLLLTLLLPTWNNGHGNDGARADTAADLHANSEGSNTILTAQAMDAGYDHGRPQEWIDSVGESLKLCVNELADVLHRFFVIEVDGSN